MQNPGFTTGRVDTDRPFFEVIHSLFKQTVARVGWTGDGSGFALQFLLEDDPQAEKVRDRVTGDLDAKLKRLAPGADTLEDLLRLLTESCCHPSNMYTEVHWLPVTPGSPEPGCE